MLDFQSLTFLFFRIRCENRNGNAGPILLPFLLDNPVPDEASTIDGQVGANIFLVALGLGILGLAGDKLDIALVFSNRQLLADEKGIGGKGCKS